MSYPNSVLANNPLAYWRLDDTGGTAADFTGHGHTGTLSGSGVTTGVSPGAVPGDAAMGFDGVAGRITTGYSPSPTSVIVWFRTTSLGQVAAYSDLGATGSFIGVSGGGLFVYYGGVGQISTAVPVADGNWHQVAWSFDGAHHAYADGQPAGNVASAVFGADAPIIIGYDTSNNVFFPGAIDEPSVYGSPLSAAQIAADYAAGIQVLSSLGARRRKTKWWS